MNGEMDFKVNQKTLEKLMVRLQKQEAILDYFVNKQPLSQLINEINSEIEPIEKDKKGKEESKK